MSAIDNVLIEFLKLAKDRAVSTGKDTAIPELDRMITELDEQISRKQGKNVFKFPGGKQ